MISIILTGYESKIDYLNGTADIDIHLLSNAGIDVDEFINHLKSMLEKE